MLEADRHELSSGEPVAVRVVVLNDSYEPVAVDRRLLVGPNLVPEPPTGPPLPISLEPALSDEERNLVYLNPWCFYGRERSWRDLPPGRVMVYAYLLRRAVDSRRPEGPGESDALLAAAPPLTLTVRAP
jgi:hypothetical protein